MDCRAQIVKGFDAENKRTVQAGGYAIKLYCQLKAADLVSPDVRVVVVGCSQHRVPDS